MFQNVTLEMSLKPFRQTDGEFIRKVCKKLFRQWYPLLKNRETVSVMLWVGDGSELLDYTGNPDDTFEWCRFLGNANVPYLAPDEPDWITLHKRKQDYIENAPVMTYGILRTIIRTLKEEGQKAFPNARIRVGETFDIGPEFAISDFKYRRHPEICTSARLDKLGFVDATAVLHGDTRHYAAYPEGIPEGTPFGTFLGQQSQVFLKDMDFDYLWLSNGLGFSADPWKKTGKIFDGETYFPDALEETRKKVFGFWQLFRAECSYPLETRGTNNSVGIDYASDGVPLYDIYNGDLDITAPPNSPWAALNDNYGLEIMGHMTRICELPGKVFPFRYYIHDPWWINSPWYDRYDGSPCDIYLPMAISRITAGGTVESANSLNLLTVDNSYGNMPDQCVNEPLPHLLKAEKDGADTPAPMVWVYPMREYTTSDGAEPLRQMNLGDNFVCDAINDGLPLCCVVSTDNFLKNATEIYRKSVMLSPVPDNPAVLSKLLAMAAEGIGVMFYGTRDRLAEIPSAHRVIKLDVEDEAANPREALADFGYRITYNKKDEEAKPPTMAIARRDSGLFFSVYNANTTTDVRMQFPFGAPILIGAEAEMVEGCSSYRFSRGEHRECRIFIEQEDGVVSCREVHPGNARYRRAIRITGLKDATVRLFPETEKECAVSLSVTNTTPDFDDRFHLVQDELYGPYLKGEHISGRITFLIGRKPGEGPKYDDLT